MTDLRELLAAVDDFYRSYVFMGEAERTVVALWTVSTYVFDCFDFTPYQHVTAPEKECGKSTLLECMNYLTAHPLKAENASPAALYRAVEEWKPVLLIDEADTSLGRDAEKERAEALRGLLNGGFHRSGRVLRCETNGDHKPRYFSTFCPKAFAGVGSYLSDTTRSRSIEIKMTRQRRDERTERMRHRDVEPRAKALRERLEAWAKIVGREALAAARPDVPAELGDRQADIWEPLLALADLAGGEWPDRARRAALALSANGALEEESSLGGILLADCRRAFDALGTDRVATSALIDQLASDEEAPWGDWRRSGGRISARALGGILRRYNIRSGTVRLEDGTTPKGYKREAFEDAWSRFLPGDPLSHPPHPPQRSSHAGLSLFDEPPQDSDVADTEEPANPHEQTDVADVADRNGGMGEEPGSEQAWLATASLDEIRSRYEGAA